MTTVQKKGEELIEYCRSQGNIPVSLEQSLSNFTDRWNTVSSLIDDRRHKALLARRRREVQDLMITLEAVIKDVERVINKFSTEVPENEYEMKSQLELCKVSGWNGIKSFIAHLLSSGFNLQWSITSFLRSVLLIPNGFLFKNNVVIHTGLQKTRLSKRES